MPDGFEIIRIDGWFDITDDFAEGDWLDPVASVRFSFQRRSTKPAWFQIHQRRTCL